MYDLITLHRLRKCYHQVSNHVYCYNHKICNYLIRLWFSAQPSCSPSPQPLHRLHWLSSLTNMMQCTYPSCHDACSMLTHVNILQYSKYTHSYIKIFNGVACNPHTNSHYSWMKNNTPIPWNNRNNSHPYLGDTFAYISTSNSQTGLRIMENQSTVHR